jgi:hypothetical protein
VTTVALALDRPSSSSAASVRTYQLLCAGRCNPAIETIDMLMRRHQKTSEEALGTEHLWNLQRRLIYTPHVMTDPTTARCTRCGAQRLYGLSSW